jgi:nucleotide-binding universal stress UspA family protein
MTIRTVLVAASGGSATEGAIELACRLAAQFGAHVEAYHVLVDPVSVFMALGASDGVGIGVPQGYIDEMSAQARATAGKVEAAFEAATKRYGLVLSHAPPSAGSSVEGTSYCWRQEMGYAPTLVAQRARFFDLVVLGRSERAISEPHTDTIEETLRYSGRPVLVAPRIAPTALGRSVAFGWNGSDESVRALATALPILAQAEKVTAITAGEETDITELTAYLMWHGVAAQHRNVPLGSGDGIGRTLLAAAHEVGADLLVMGGYGQRPWRQALFGGATREVVGADTKLALLLVH